MTHVRTFLAAEALAFAAAAMVHAGFLLGGYTHREASIAESVIAGVLTVALVLTAAAPQASRAIGLAAQGFALAGTFVGLFTMMIGVGPQTGFDIALHACFVTLLVAGVSVVARQHATVVTRTE